MHTRNTFRWAAIGPIIAISLLSAESTTFAQTWVRRSEGGFVDGGEPLVATRSNSNPVTTLRKSTGELWYFFPSNLGRVMGRVSSTARWELWSQGNWASDADMVPSSLGHGYAKYRSLTVVDNPTQVDGFVGVAGQVDLLYGTIGTNSHPQPISILFDGIEFRQWNGGTDFAPLKSTGLIKSWSTSAVNARFAFDPEAQKGILLGVFGWHFTPFRPQLTATQYTHNDPAQTWRRWDNPESGTPKWHSDNVWPPFTNTELSRDAFILNRDENVGEFAFRNLDITFLPNSGNFLITTDYYSWSGGPAGSGGKLKAVYYEENQPATPEWKWWDGTAWQQGAPYNYTGISNLATTARRQLYWHDGIVSILINDDFGNLVEILYDDVLRSFSAETTIASVSDATCSSPCRGTLQPNFCVAVHPGTGELWLVYTKPNAKLETDLRTIWLKTRSPDPNSEWSGPQPIFVAAQDSIPEALDFVGVGAAAEPVVFLLDIGANNESEVRLFTIGQDTSFWSGEVALQVDPFPTRVLLDSGQLSFAIAIPNDADGTPYSASAPGPIAADTNGYLYAPRAGNTSLIVHPPGTTGTATNHAWGAFHDHLPRPSGAAVDNGGQRVYIANTLLTTPGDLSQLRGRIDIWDFARRDNNYGWAGGGNPLDPSFDREYYPTEIFRFSTTQGTEYFEWPSDVAVDEVCGLLYVVSSFKHQVDVFDIVNVIDDATPFAKCGLFEDKIGPSNLEHVQQLVDDLIFVNDPGYLDPNPGNGNLIWSQPDLEGKIIPFLKGRPAYGKISGGNDDTDFIRNVYKHHQARHDLPVYWYSFGGLGSKTGEMMFPTGIDVISGSSVYVVDSGNQRVQQFVIEEVSCQVSFVSTWGSYGRDAGEFVYPFGVAVDGAQGCVYITDPFNGRVQVFDSTGTFIHEFGKYGNDAFTAELKDSMGIGVNGTSVYLGVDGDVVTFDVVP